MRRLLAYAIFCLAIWATAMAVPAKPGVRIIKQADGTTIHLRLAGDEWHHSFTTDEGLTVARGVDGNFYYRTAAGMSTVVAHDASQRSEQEKAYVTANTENLSLKSLFTTAQRARRSKALVARKASQVPQTGSPRIPVILVNYKDKKFISSNPVDAWKKQISNPGEVSVYQYFVDQSFGKYTPQFDIYGPYNLANNRSYYGGNDYYGEDKRVGTMVGEACQGMDSTIDWSKYDNDGDGMCDVVIVLYAGDGEASSWDSDAENAVWPCQWELSDSDFGKDLTMDGVTVSKFAVFNEVNGYDLKKLDGIGTFCHEFSHCLDLPDFYDTEYGKHFGMGSWSLLDNGSYNNDGYTPCGYTAYERNFMGWFDYTDPKEGTRYTTKTVQDGGEAYKITSNNPNEYYIIENIQQTGWNKHAFASGLQVTHVNYNATTWLENTVNNSNAQGMTIIPADNSLKLDYDMGYYYINEEDQEGDLFPYNGHNELTATSTPAATLYNSSAKLDKPITQITKNSDGTVSFTYIEQPLPTPVAAEATAVSGDGFTANWSACEDAVSYTLKVTPKGDAEVILTETFAKCKETVTSNFKLDTYMDNPGWTGSAMYIEPGGVRLSSGKNAGSITSPALDLAGSNGKTTVMVKAKCYNSDTNCSLTIKVGDASEKVTVESSTEQTFVVTLDCVQDAAQQLTLSAIQGKRVVITGIEVYSGDASSMLSAPARVASEDRKPSGEIIVTGITTTSYKLTGLSPETEYKYVVKAIYDGDESAWSNAVTVITSGETIIKGDVNADGVVDINDINILINIILGVDDASVYNGRADLNGDGTVDVSDINETIVIIMK